MFSGIKAFESFQYESGGAEVGDAEFEVLSHQIITSLPSYMRTSLQQLMTKHVWRGTDMCLDFGVIRIIFC